MKTTNIYSEAVKHIPADVQKGTEFCFAVADRIHQFLIVKGMSHKDLAEMMGKTEANVAAWVSGQYDFSLRMLVEISVAHGEDLVKI